MKRILKLTASFLFGINALVHAQMTCTPMTPQQLVQNVLAGSGVTIRM